ncbi:MAG: hypothetical protein JWO92_2104 [Chitinophagaceae bacterium]|nr:hypothetical protein [Chitinophagaceae bacterium]
MIYKFLKPPNLFKEVLTTYKGSYVEMCVPQTEDEKYCYVELTEKQFPAFAQHFGNNEIELQNDADEYPAGIHSKISNRIEKFTVVRPGNRATPF